MPVNVVVTAERLGQRPIDLKQCGQFIEVLCNLIPSMLAQQVANTSFEEEPPFKVQYKAETDKPYRPWYPDGAVHRAKYSFDTDNPFNGNRSQKIELPVAHCRAAISQDGYYTKQDVTYRLRLHMRSQGNVPVWASLHGGGGPIAGPVVLGRPAVDGASRPASGTSRDGSSTSALGRAGDAWGLAEADLRATRTIENATLTIEFEGPGTLWLDRVYLLGEDAVLGAWRTDVVEAIKAMNCGMIRFGGSTINDYEWDRSIGPWDARAPFTTCWGGLEENFVGMEEFVQLCRRVGAEPQLCIRWHGKKPEDAAAQVEYFNGSADTKWGRLRGQNGHPEPYGVVYWQIGNEVGGKEYDASVKAFAEAMKGVDPSIKILSSFPSEETLTRGEGYLDYLCPHHYGCENLGAMDKGLKRLQEIIAQHAGERDVRLSGTGRSAGGRDVRVAVTEWNTTAGDWGLGRATLQTLSNALSCSRYHNLLQRYADLVEIAIRSNLVDSFGSGVIQTGPGWLYLAPTYYAQQLYTRAAGTFPLRVRVTPELPWDRQPVDVSATLNEDGKCLRIYAVNTTPEPATVNILLADGLSPTSGGTVYVLKDRDGAGCAEVMNTRDDPTRISAKSHPWDVKGKEFQVALDPFSLTLLEVQLAS